MKTRQCSRVGIFAIGLVFVGLLITTYRYYSLGPEIVEEMHANIKTEIHEAKGKTEIHEAKGKTENVEKLSAIWKFVYSKQYDCSDKIYVGGKMGVDGAYYLCKEKKYWPYPASFDRCLVYSFGIDWDFKFDDAIAEMGCEVHAFDPSMDLAEGTKRESGVVFHKIGIAEQDSDSGYNGWKMRTLKTLMKELGHEDRILDYLKVDTDKADGSGFEVVVMHELINTGLYKCVRQYAMEIHMPGPLYNEINMNRCRDIHNVMETLNKGGFRLYETVDNVRALQYYHPDLDQMWVKQSQYRGENTLVLWESHFVNENLKGSCKDYLQ